MMIYLIGTTITFGILLNAFLSDRSTSKADALSWLVLLIGTTLWFVILPFMIRRKLIGATASRACRQSNSGVKLSQVMMQAQQ